MIHPSTTKTIPDSEERRRTKALVEFMAMVEREPELFLPLFEEASGRCREMDAEDVATALTQHLADIMPDVSQLDPKTRLRSAEIMILLRRHILTEWAGRAEHGNDWVGPQR